MPSILQPYVSQVLSALLGAHRGQTSVSSWSQVILQFHHTAPEPNPNPNPSPNPYPNPNPNPSP